MGGPDIFSFIVGAQTFISLGPSNTFRFILWAQSLLRLGPNNFNSVWGPHDLFSIVCLQLVCLPA